MQTSFSIKIGKYIHIIAMETKRQHTYFHKCVLLKCQGFFFILFANTLFFLQLQQFWYEMFKSVEKKAKIFEFL